MCNQVSWESRIANMIGRYFAQSNALKGHFWSKSTEKLEIAGNPGNAVT